MERDDVLLVSLKKTESGLTATIIPFGEHWGAYIYFISLKTKFHHKDEIICTFKFENIHGFEAPPWQLFIKTNHVETK